MSHCPETGTAGKKVDGATIKSMMRGSLRDVQDEQYYFCDVADCDVVYFSETGEHLIHKHEIREFVYQKEGYRDDVQICYCFQHTIGDVKRAVDNTDEGRILDDIKQGIQAGQCACDWRNPQGNCCLGNVRELIRMLKSHEK